MHLLLGKNKKSRKFFSNFLKNIVNYRKDDRDCSDYWKFAAALKILCTIFVNFISDIFAYTATHIAP